MWTVSEGWLEALTAGLRDIRLVFRSAWPKTNSKTSISNKAIGKQRLHWRRGAQSRIFLFPRIFRGQSEIRDRGSPWLRKARRM
jgi:hypothetical protein